MSEPAAATLAFCDDTGLRYDKWRRVFRPGDRLQFDDAYRLAHLPLVAPGHPAVIRAVPGKDYLDGIYRQTRHALVLPVAAAALTASPVFQEVERALRASPFAVKIAWDICARRAGHLHATIASGLSEEAAERAATAIAHVLPRLGPLAFRLHGPFVGSKNTGRIYFPVYPQAVDGDDPLALIQDSIGVVRTHFYAVGYYNLTGEFGIEETFQLAQIIDRWRSTVVAELPLSSLLVHATNDDLVLSGRDVITIAGDGVLIRPHGGTGKKLL